MTKFTLRIATRQSPLALWQAQFVRDQLHVIHPHLIIEFVPIVTKGDLILDKTLSRIGGKGLFVKELELALLANTADIAVHSMKDLPMELPDGLTLATICQREDPRDAFVSAHYTNIEQLPLQSIVGTSSLRRQCQLSAYRPDLFIHNLRGNVGTRLKKLDAGEYDAIILAVAGLKRLGLSERIMSILPVELSLPAAGQGAIGIECRRSDPFIHELIAPLNDPITRCCVLAERALTIYLQGGCQLPIASYAEINQNQLWLRATIGTPDGKKIIYDEKIGSCTEPEALGINLAKQLLQQGADKILQQVKCEIEKP